MWDAVWDLAREGSPSAEMTFPRARRPLLIEIPSLIRSPAAAVRLSWMTSVSSEIRRHDDDAYPLRTSEIDEMEFGHNCDPFTGLVVVSTLRSVAGVPKGARRSQASSSPHCGSEAGSTGPRECR